MSSSAAESESRSLSMGQCAALACLLEATAPKPGNVHRGADFEDLTYPDLVTSGIVIAPVFDAAPELALGRTVLEAVRRTKQAVETNSNLGMILLFAPLAIVPPGVPLREGIATVLDSLGPEDARLVYEAIRHARPGGLGQAETADVAGDPPANLIDAMRLAKDRDMVARQYANGFKEVIEIVVPHLRKKLVTRGMSLSRAIVDAHVSFMAEFPDSLIARKCGEHVALESAARARYVLEMGGPEDPEYERRLADLDFWLRSDGHRRNPGTTADLIAAGLFAALREGIIASPFK